MPADTPNPRPKLYDGHNITPEEIKASVLRHFDPKRAAEIYEVKCPEVSPPPPHNRGINWKPGR